MTGDVLLREVADDDLDVFFEQQRDPEASHMAAFTAKDPADRDAFDAHWRKIRADGSVAVRTVLVDGRVAGHVASYVDEALGAPEVTYWIGKEYWGRGVATFVLGAFLDIVTERPIYGRAATDNVASLRVLAKCGFVVIGRDEGFANARGTEVEEVVLKLAADDGISATEGTSATAGARRREAGPPPARA